jgi:hypothetical protein
LSDFFDCQFGSSQPQACISISVGIVLRQSANGVLKCVLESWTVFLGGGAVPGLDESVVGFGDLGGFFERHKVAASALLGLDASGVEEAAELNDSITSDRHSPTSVEAAAAPNDLLGARHRVREILAGLAGAGACAVALVGVSGSSSELDVVPASWVMSTGG